MSIGTYNSSSFRSKDDFKTLDDFFRFFYTQKNGYIYSAKKLYDGDFKQHSVSLERLNYDNLSDSKCRFADVVSGKSYDRYFTLNQFCYIKGADRKPCLARRTDNIKRLNALYVDIDYYNLKLSKEQVYFALHDFLSDYGLPQYTMLIDSGRGFYVIWKLQNEDRNAHSRWEKIERLFCDRLSSLGADPKAVDCSRVLRVPFSYNSKNNSMVGLVDFVDVSYSLEELTREYLGERLPKKTHDNEEATQAMKNCAYAISNTHNIPLPCNVDDKDSFNKVYAFIDEHKHLIKSVKVCYKLTGEIPFYRSIQCSQNAEDISALMGLRHGRENGFREQALFLYRTMLMWATNDAQIALERTLELNASFSTPLDEMTVINATESAEKHYKKYNYCRKTLSTLLSISKEESSSLCFFLFAVIPASIYARTVTVLTARVRTASIICVLLRRKGYLQKPLRLMKDEIAFWKCLTTALVLMICARNFIFPLLLFAVICLLLAFLLMTVRLLLNLNLTVNLMWLKPLKLLTILRFHFLRVALIIYLVLCTERSFLPLVGLINLSVCKMMIKT